MILKLLDFQQLFKIKLAFILTYPIDFITCTGLQGLPSGELDEVVWGNQNTIDRQLNQLGDRKTLIEWFTDWK